MRILWHSTAPWGPSSYSVLTGRTVPDLVRMGHEVVVSTWYGLQGALMPWQIKPRGEPKGATVGTVKVLPCFNGANYGVDTLLAAYEWAKADVCISCMDAWVLPPMLTSRMTFAPWLPVDHDPCPQGIVDSVRAAAYPMTYSRWGAEVLRSAGVEAHYVPCSADASVFVPLDKAAARKRLDMPAKAGFVASMVAANKDSSDRKGFSEALQGFAKFAQAHDDAYLYIHTFWNGPINIGNLAQRCGIADRVIQCDQFGYLMGLFDDAYMRAVYAASDLLLNPAKSEGFGLPLLEAQMCGTPVAATDFSTTDELLFAGWKIPGQRHWSMGAESFRLLASVDGVADVLEEAYRARGSETLAKQARRGASALDTKRVVEEFWRPALSEIEKIACGGGKLQLVTF